MGNMMKSGAALLGLGVLWTTVALGGKDATSSEPSVNERLAATVRIEISAPGGQRWLPTYVLRDRAQVRALTTALAKHPLYQGDPAGWIHEVEIKFYPARGEPLIAYTHSSEVLGHSDSFLSYQGGGERLLSKAMARQLIPFVKRAEAMKAKEPVNLSGTWEGQVLFTSGARARVSLELKAARTGRELHPPRARRARTREAPDRQGQGVAGRHDPQPAPARRADLPRRARRRRQPRRASPLRLLPRPRPRGRVRALALSQVRARLAHPLTPGRWAL